MELFNGCGDIYARCCEILRRDSMAKNVRGCVQNTNRTGSEWKGTNKSEILRDSVTEICRGQAICSLIFRNSVRFAEINSLKLLIQPMCFRSRPWYLNHIDFPPNQQWPHCNDFTIYMYTERIATCTSTKKLEFNHDMG